MLNKIRKRIKGFILRKELRKKDVILKENVKIRKTSFEGNNLVGKNVDLEGSRIGVGSAIGENSELSKVKIGKFCSIGPNSNIALGKHPSHTFVTTHTFGFDNIDLGIGLKFLETSKFEGSSYACDKYYLNIGNDVWVGKNVTFLSGINIGDGAIVAAGAVVTKDVEPYSIVGGLPAKEMRKRFSEEEIEFLLDFKWWDRDIEWIKANVDSFEDIDKFIKKLKTI